MPKAAVFTMKLEPDLRADFMAAAEASHRPASQVVRELMREFVERQDHTAFLQRKVDKRVLRSTQGRDALIRKSKLGSLRAVPGSLAGGEDHMDAGSRA